MIYPDQAIRASLEDGRKALSAGDLAYQVSKLLNDFLAMNGVGDGAIAEAVGALELAKAEFYRRIVAPRADNEARACGELYTVISQ